MPDNDQKASILPASEEATMRWSCYLQKLSLRVASGSLMHAPTLDDCAGVIERMRQVFEHFEYAMDVYAEAHGRDLSGYVHEAAALADFPGTWAESVVASLVLSVASQVEVRHRLALAGPTRPLLRQLADKTEHIEAGRAALRDLASRPEYECRDIPALVSRWLDLALATLDARTRDSYLAQVEPAVQPWIG